MMAVTPKSTVALAQGTRHVLHCATFPKVQSARQVGCHRQRCCRFSRITGLDLTALDIRSRTRLRWLRMMALPPENPMRYNASNSCNWYFQLGQSCRRVGSTGISAENAVSLKDVLDFYRPKIISAAFSAIMIVGEFVLPDVIVGMTEASTTRRFSIPFTRKSGPTTAASSGPIRHVRQGGKSWYRCRQPYGPNLHPTDTLHRG